MLILEACTNMSVLGTILFAKKIVNIISIIVPILLVLLVTIDFAKAVIANSDDDMKRAQSLAIKRIIIGLVVFFVPLIVDTAFTSLSDKGISGIDCYNKATENEVDKLIADAKEKEKKTEEERQKNLANSKEKTAQYQANQKALREQFAASASTVSDIASQAISNVCTNCTSSEKIAQTAEQLSWPKKPKSSYEYRYGNKKFSSWSELTHAKPTQAFMNAMDKVYPKHFKWSTNYPAIRTGQSCDTFVGVVVKASGYDSIGRNHDSQHTAFTTHKTKWKKVSKPQRGDICRDSSHVKIYLGDGKIAEAGYGHAFGHISSGKCGSSIRIWRAIK